MPNQGPAPFFLQQSLATLNQDGLLTAEGYRAILAARTMTLVDVQTSEYTAAARQFVPVNPTGGAFPLHLPLIPGLVVEDAIVVVNLSDSILAVTVDALGGKLINGASSYAFAVARGLVSFIPVHGAWVASPPV